MSEYIIKVENLAKLRKLAGLHVKETLELTSGKIVRCRDCRHYDADGEPSEVYPDRHWCDRMTVYILPSGFCSEARKVDE